MMRGIYILANDVVYNQLIALLNSIEVNYRRDIPVCVIPYDERVDKVQSEIRRRKNATMFEDRASLARWEEFAIKIWKTHPTAYKEWASLTRDETYRLGMHYKFCVFDGPYDEFIYLDCDTLVMNTLDYVFDKISQYDFVVYDFQHKGDVIHVYDTKSPKLLNVFPQERIDKEIFCAAFFASKKGLFNEERISYILTELEKGEAEILYAAAPDQAILNYMVMKSHIPVYNFALNLPKDEITGNCVVSTHFVDKDHILYDKGARLTYFHYIGIPAQVFTKLCAGENLDFRYRDVFLHYRYLYESEKRPIFKGKLRPYNQPPSLARRFLRKLKSIARHIWHGA